MISSTIPGWESRPTAQCRSDSQVVCADPQRHCLGQEAAFDEITGAWNGNIVRHKLRPHTGSSASQAGSFATVVIGSTWDIVFDTGTTRRFGVRGLGDSKEIMLQLLVASRARLTQERSS